MPRRQEMIWVFAFGSNNLAQMKRRTGLRSIVQMKAVVDDYKICFRRRSRRWGGGVAYALPSENGRLLGAAYKVPKNALQGLDEAEGVFMRSQPYMRQKITMRVRYQDGWHDEVGFMYNNEAIALDTSQFVTPTIEYLQAVVQTLNEVGWKKRSANGSLRRFRTSDINIR
jgi:hypothetical protein